MMRDYLIKTILVMVMVITMILLLIDAYCSADPFLVYDPTINILGYEVEINGEVSAVAPNVVGDNMQLVYDLKDLPEGENKIRARAQFELWGWNEWSSEYIVVRPSQLQNPQITTNPQSPLQ